MSTILRLRSRKSNARRRGARLARHGLSIRRALLACAALTLASASARADPHEPASDGALAALCGIVEDSAKASGLPADFLTRLIWRESAFQPRAVSPVGAQGVAQFMPGTAADRGLANPFDPESAIPASAKLLADLSRQFGNLGFAAAAYNAGPKTLRRWLDGEGDMPFETQAYVRAITGHDIEEFRDPKPPPASPPGPVQPCLVAIAKLRVAPWPKGESPVISGLFAPWGVQLAASFDKGSALRAFARAQHDLRSVIGDMQPFVLGSVLRSRGWRPFYRVRLGAQTGGEAKRLCDKIQAAGGACAILKS
jgi:hypothetical protein